MNQIDVVVHVSIRVATTYTCIHLFHRSLDTREMQGIAGRASLWSGPIILYLHAVIAGEKTKTENVSVYSIYYHLLVWG